MPLRMEERQRKQGYPSATKMARISGIGLLLLFMTSPRYILSKRECIDEADVPRFSS